MASHANLRTREGTSGGASHKRSVEHAAIREHLSRLGRALGWHGALSADVIVTDAGPLVVDVNPRLVEPMNAWRSGVDLVGAMVDLATGQSPEPQPPGPAGVDTHQLLLAVLGAAAGGGGRPGVLRELAAAARHRGSYAGSREELTPIRHDWRAAMPVALASALTLVTPAWGRVLSSGSVASYALTPAAFSQVRDHAAPAAPRC